MGSFLTVPRQSIPDISVLTITIEAIRANTHLKRSKTTVHRVTSRCNHWNFDQNNAYIQPTRRWAQRLQQSIILHITEFNMNYYYKPSSNSFINKYFQSLIVQRKINNSSNDDTRYHDEARTWHHSALSSLVGDNSIPLTNQKEEYTAKSN
jgi:hypothetical protein